MGAFDRQTAFITGGASGFGRALAAEFLVRGGTVVIADRDERGAAAARAALAALGNAYGVACDVADYGSVRGAAERAINIAGPIRYVFNNAGILAPAPFGAGDLQDWRWSLSVNVLGVVHGIEAFLPHMRAHGQGGHFVNTASIAGFGGLPNGGPYCASKSAVISISESLSAEVQAESIHVSVACPGFMSTQLHQSSLARPPNFGGAKTILLASRPTVGATLSQSIETGLAPTVRA
jgi:NAD(P)-dependent dehydrogenase (short-subunit alcohol dehydrogenase family)